MTGDQFVTFPMAKIPCQSLESADNNKTPIVRPKALRKSGLGSRNLEARAAEKIRRHYLEEIGTIHVAGKNLSSARY